MCYKTSSMVMGTMDRDHREREECVSGGKSGGRRGEQTDRQTERDSQASAGTVH